LFRIISIPSKCRYVLPPDHVISMELLALNFRCQCTQHATKTPIYMCRFNVRSSTLKNLNMFCKRQISIKLFYLHQRFQCRHKYFFKIKLVFFLYLRCQHHQRKTICLYVYISDIRQIVGYGTPVCIQRFPWRLHITITYNLPYLRL
jgi:hypothetical protein